MSNPKVFISYSWEEETKNWVTKLATALREKGVDAKLDQWELVPGDQLTHFMERSVRENDYVLIICTPKYKVKSDNRIGGVGYEGDIMTSEVLLTANNRKFIPVLQTGTIQTSMPTWLQGRFHLNLSTEEAYRQNFEDLLATLFNQRQQAPPLGNHTPRTPEAPIVPERISPPVNDDIRILGILLDKVSVPTRDGSAGSALYNIPFELSKTPPYQWQELFIQSWNRPPSFSQMHRPGIASVSGNIIWLKGTEMEEVARYHKATLKLAVGVANSLYNQMISRQHHAAEAEKQRIEEHKKNIRDIGSNIRFDD